MFSIIWESETSYKLKVVTNQHNEFLMQADNQFMLLSELSNCSYDVFASSDMDQLTLELHLLKNKLTDNESILHVSEIIELAMQCKSRPGSRLIFTPFKIMK